MTDPDTQNIGRDGLSGPSELGIVSTGDLIAMILGGGFYFIPPIPNKRIRDIGQQFFDNPLEQCCLSEFVLRMINGI